MTLLTSAISSAGNVKTTKYNVSNVEVVNTCLGALKERGDYLVDAHRAKRIMLEPFATIVCRVQEGLFTSNRVIGSLISQVFTYIRGRGMTRYVITVQCLAGSCPEIAQSSYFKDSFSTLSQRG